MRVRGFRSSAVAGRQCLLPAICLAVLSCAGNGPTVDVIDVTAVEVIDVTAVEVIDVTAVEVIDVTAVEVIDVTAMEVVDELMPEVVGNCFNDSDCDDPNPDDCFFPGCDPLDGQCTTTVQHPTGHPCQDGNPCTESDQCIDGNCVGELLPREQLVEHECTCQENADCNPLEDNDLCNGTLHCVQKEIDAELKLVCAVDPDTVLSCNDAVNCTVDQCDPELGCQSIPDDEYCDDENLCTDDVCVVDSGGCQNIPVEDGTTCSDGWECQTGVCVCLPDCTDKLCGDDGCQGSCGPCGQQEACVDGQCQCIPDCELAQCGDDGCSGSCGQCSGKQVCTDVRQCVTEDMVLVPAGSFWMGCNDTGDPPLDPNCESDEYPQHEVTVPAFKMDRFEITAAEFAAFMTHQTGLGYYNECEYEQTLFECIHIGSTDTKVVLVDDSYWVALPDQGNRPMVEVSWYAAHAYCAWRGKRMCSESEWEKAARGGCELYETDCQTQTQVFPWGSYGPDPCAHAAASGCGWGNVQPVGSFPAGASPYGVLDMAGNAYEWTADSWHSSYEGAPDDGSPWMEEGQKKAVVHGGCIYPLPMGIRSSDRYYQARGYHDCTLGIRCCSDASE